MPHKFLLPTFGEIQFVFRIKKAKNEHWLPMFVFRHVNQ